MTLPLPGIEPDTIDRALTLTQPWAGLIALGIKRIENRPWKLTKSLVGRRFAIHASREVDLDVVQHLTDVLHLKPHPLWTVTSALVGVVRATGCVTSLDELRHRFNGDVDPDQERFWMGPYAFLLDGARVIPGPIQCKGSLGFWGLSESLAHQVTEQLKEAA